MSMRKQIISLSIIAILSLCTLSVASASTSKTTTVDHHAYARSATAQQPTTLTFTVPAQVKLFQPYPVSGSLTTADGTGISGAQIWYQWLNGDKWDTTGMMFTFGKNGSFSDTWIETGLFNKQKFCLYRIIYNGNSQYAPAVSNEVNVTIS